VTVSDAKLVLVVDDDEMIRRLVRTVLEADDFSVVEAKSGDEALQMVDDAKPAIVVLDVMMPGLNGVDVCRQLDHDNVKVIILTARDDAAIAEECMKAGADAFLTKPFSSIQLLDLVEELLAA
jgi:two-component system, OmpR family, phosphate regulon response regulator PhoB